MTTVFIDNYHKIAITDTRVTTTYYSGLDLFLRKFFKNIKGEVQFGIVGQKAIYVHDHLLLCSGDTDTIHKVLNALIELRINDFRASSDWGSCKCVWVIGDYYIQFNVHKGKFTKKVIFMHNTFQMSFGSGSFTLPICQVIDSNGFYEVDEIIEKFKLVTRFDKYTNDDLKIYRF